MSDTETLNESKSRKKQKKKHNSEDDCDELSDFPSMSVDLFKRLNIKVAFFLTLMGIFLFSDIFIEKFLPDKYKDESGTSTNTYGTAVQLIIFILFYIIVDILIQGGIL